jgi:hypothetical protein
MKEDLLQYIPYRGMVYIRLFIEEVFNGTTSKRGSYDENADAPWC